MFFSSELVAGKQLTWVMKKGNKSSWGWWVLERYGFNFHPSSIMIIEGIFSAQLSKQICLVFSFFIRIQVLLKILPSNKENFRSISEKLFHKSLCVRIRIPEGTVVPEFRAFCLWINIYLFGVLSDVLYNCVWPQNLAIILINRILWLSLSTSCELTLRSGPLHLLNNRISIHLDVIVNFSYF